jgi:hypothetical protein
MAGYRTSWLGNSFGDFAKHVQKDGHSLAVTPDGKCYVGGTWDESQQGIGIYQNGDVVGQLTLFSQTNGMLAVDGKYAFGGTSMPIKNADGKSVFTQGIVRCHLDGTPAPFEGGVLFGRGGGANFLPLSTTWLAGACLGSSELFIGDLEKNQVRVFDESTMKEKRAFACDQPFRLATNGKTLWVLRRETNYRMNQPTQLVEYSLDGKPTGKSIPDAELVGALCLAFDHAGHLLVGGPQQQVVKYDVSAAPRVVSTLGVKDGLWSGTPGEMAPDKLYNIWGVGGDAAGNVYVLNRAPAVGGSTDLRAFSPQGKLLWQLACNQFTDVADVDPASNGTDLYTRDEHFVMDYSKPTGQQATLKGYTLDPKFDDGRLENKIPGGMFTWGSPLVRRLDGRLYLFERPGNYLGIFRRGAGETFVPSGLLDIAPQWKKKLTDATTPHFYSWPQEQPKTERWIWRDQNGDGQISKDEFEVRNPFEDITVSSSWVDGKGGIWMCGADAGNRVLWHLPLRGFDAHQNPIYKTEDLQPIKPPDEFLRADRINYHDVTRLIYDDAHDAMYLSGTTEEHPKSVHGQSMGTEVLRYDNWSKPEARKLRWRIVLPDDLNDQYSFFNAMALAGNRLFCVQRHLSNIFVYDTETGKNVGLLAPGAEVGGNMGWIDMPEGTTAYQEKDGSILVFTEDDFKERIVFYRLPPQ